MQTRKLQLRRIGKLKEKKRPPDRKKSEKRRSHSISSTPPQNSRPNNQMEIEESKEEQVPPFLQVKSSFPHLFLQGNDVNGGSQPNRQALSAMVPFFTVILIFQSNRVDQEQQLDNQQLPNHNSNPLPAIFPEVQALTESIQQLGGLLPQDNSQQSNDF